ncbi:MAG: hypothetical protein ACI9FO_000999 [Methylophagaceae bacterium]|jgi:uncharacterized protein
MHQKLPKDIDPFRLAQNGLRFEGTLPVSIMQRLVGSLADTDGQVAVTMNFDVDETGLPYMHGKFSSKLSLICERCMTPMPVNVDVECYLAILKNERKVEGLAELYDPWIVENNDLIALSSVVEDELILALPLVPRHDHACLPKEAWYRGDDIDENAKEKKVSPFDVLASLKLKK